MIRLTRRYRFSASHRLHSDALTDSANRDIYGKCNNPYGHGHDYVIEVSVRGPVDAGTGQVANLAALDSLVKSSVLDSFEHKNLNADVSEFQTLVPTSENVLGTIEARLAGNWKLAFPGQWPELDQVRLRETKKNSFELKA